ncbi:MAG: hypothetical protein FJX59_18060 [Alphaproteobacteria bacterium]|nr:hypothetical protein [Alphaproteobacteria bacterium]
MTSMFWFHFLHVVAFAVVVTVDLPAFYAARRAAEPRAPAGSVLLAAQIMRWTTALSGIALVLFMPLGVELGIDLGVYDLMAPGWLTATWAVSLAWLALVIFAGLQGTSALGRRLYTVEIWVRAIIGLGNVYDGAVGFGGEGLIHGDWLALKIFLFGIALLASAWVRAKLRPVREALGAINPLSAQMSTFDRQTASNISALLSKARPGVHTIWLVCLIAAWMGINKPF